MSLMCSFFGHKYEEVARYRIASGPLGCGTLVHKTCTRCGHEKFSFEIDLNVTADNIKQLVVPNDTSSTSTADDSGPTLVSEARSPRKAKKVQDSTTCDKD